MQLTNRSKIVVNKEMSFKEKMYLPAILSGLAITIKHLFRKSATVKYPEQVRHIAPGDRGQHVLKRDEQGHERFAWHGAGAAAQGHAALSGGRAGVV